MHKELIKQVIKETYNNNNMLYDGYVVTNRSIYHVGTVTPLLTLTDDRVIFNDKQNYRSVTENMLLSEAKQLIKNKILRKV